MVLSTESKSAFKADFSSLSRVYSDKELTLETSASKTFQWPIYKATQFLKTSYVVIPSLSPTLSPIHPPSHPPSHPSTHPLTHPLTHPPTPQPPPMERHSFFKNLPPLKKRKELYNYQFRAAGNELVPCDRAVTDGLSKYQNYNDDIGQSIQI